MRTILLIATIIWLITAGIECTNRLALQSFASEIFDGTTAAYEIDPIRSSSTQPVRMGDAKRLLAMSQLAGISIIPAGLAITIGWISLLRKKNN